MFVCTRHFKPAAITLASCLALGACAADDIGSSSDYATDSFAKPTEHGELSFAHANQAQFTEEKRFHSWVFTLTAEATVDIRTDLHANNLDSVIYLYRRESAEQNWGSSIAKNDDYDGNLWSRISKTFPAGEYRLKVKATKVQLRGSFSVLGSCEGEGCPVVDTGQCNLATQLPLPQATPFNGDCAKRIEDAITSEVHSTDEATLPVSRKCDMGEIVGRSIDYYRQYFTQFGATDPFEDALDWDEDPEAGIRVIYQDSGTQVSIDAQGDEDQLTFVYDGQNQLLSVYWSNQSPAVEWYCGETGEPALPSEPSPECLRDSMNAFPHGDEVLGGDGSTTVNAADDIGHMVPTAVEAFAIEHGLSGTTVVDYNYESWESVEYDNGSRVYLTSAGKSAEYLLAQSYNGIMVIMKDGEFVCE